MRVFKILLVLLAGAFFASCGTDSSPTLYDVQVSITPEEGGIISPTADSLYEEGTQITLIAEASEGYIFAGWSGDIDTTTNPLSLIVDKDYSLRASFERKMYELTVNTSGDGTVSEEVVQTTNTTEYDHGTIVELTANPAEGWTFVEWQGDLSGSENPDQITVDEPKEITAVFEEDGFELDITVDGKGTIDTVLISGRRQGNGFTFNSVVEITVNPSEGWEFENWGGELEGFGDSNPIEVNIREDITGTARLNEIGSEFSGGNGTEDDPYQIASYEQFKAIGRDFQSSYFIQIADIDASSSATEEYPRIIPGELYDGQGHRITNLTVTFGAPLRECNEVRNLVVENVSVKSASNNTGGLCTTANLIENIQISGRVESDNDGRFAGTGGIIGSGIDLGLGLGDVSTIIRNVQSDVEVIGVNNVGGLSGKFTKIINSSSSGSVSGRDFAGGLVGFGGGAENSHSTGSVSGRSNIGGLVGDEILDIINSYATGNVTATESNAGGLAGAADVSSSSMVVIQSYATGNVTAPVKAGGLFGRADGPSIDMCFATGDVVGEQNIGGLIGEHTDGNLTKSYASGSVEGQINIGGLIGFHNKEGFEPGNVANTYALGDVEGVENVGGLIGQYLKGEVVLSFSKGRVSGTTAVGGAIGLFDGDGDLAAIYWDLETSNQQNGIGSGSSEGVIGLQTSEITGSAAEDNIPEFDFVEIWETTESYPTLRWQE